MVGDMPGGGPEPGEDTPIDVQPDEDEGDVGIIPDEEPEVDADDGADAIVEALRAELAEAKQALVEKEEEARRLDPTADVSGYLYKTREQVIEFFGVDKLTAVVEDRIATDNKARTRQGYDRLTFTSEEKQRLREDLIDELLADRDQAAPPVEGHLSRSIKMVAPDGSLRQIPYEGQINNVAGSLADGYVRYEKKGYKRTRPNMCPTTDCYREAVVENGQFSHFGYCSRDHYLRTERPENPAAVA